MGFLYFGMVKRGLCMINQDSGHWNGKPNLKMKNTVKWRYLIIKRGKIGILRFGMVGRGLIMINQDGGHQIGKPNFKIENMVN